ncbi:thiol-disulfide oxidoreductase DCC family protein [Rossellomorea sp. SC111]|uniref:thiol-disulfide oxidoreductase DCC family protein n=1 Tax=Rossellomorea sp. SC111 TaxID=2968985 RepID=UPI00215AE13B|nr:thiol-disulfide oxidoreductase DCC family protein [Rossellomorea sp. SC111]MCR8847203.1 thiol-disulfide oxidoreductase DCC family protein [Rossellomorea sp. SC111]
MRIILFDGICNFCNSSVRFIIKRDARGEFRFASLQSEIGQTLLEKHNIPKTTDSFVLVDGDHSSIESTAALKVCSKLMWPWKIFGLFLVIPKPLRDSIYRVIARNRYKWFGKQESCMIPSKEIRERFIE